MYSCESRHLGQRPDWCKGFDVNFYLAARDHHGGNIVYSVYRSGDSGIRTHKFNGYGPMVWHTLVEV